nr:unnamed protein product [Callosobruchus chinensis]
MPSTKLASSDVFLRLVETVDKWSFS